MTVKPMTEQHLEFLSLKEGCTSPSESTLVKMPHCWKSRVNAGVFGDLFSISDGLSIRWSLNLTGNG